MSAQDKIAQILIYLNINAKTFSEKLGYERPQIIYDIQSLYKEVTGYDTYPQAAIFVSNKALSTKLEAIIEVINKIDSSIASFNEDPIDLQLLSDEVDFKGLGFDDVVLLSEAYERMALDFVSGNECVDEVRHFLELFDIEYRDTMYVK